MITITGYTEQICEHFGSELEENSWDDGASLKS
jgi:hypothetical protein